MTLKRKSFFIVTHKKYDFFLKVISTSLLLLYLIILKYYTQYFVFCKVFVLIKPQYIVLLIYAYENVCTIVIVGEVRDSAAIDMLTAMNTGHDGSLSTGHANSAYDMITRLESMVLMGIELPMEAVRRQIASAVDIIIHLGRLRDGSRKVTEICEVTGIENGQVQLTSLYEFEEQAEKGRKTVQGYLKKKAALQNKEKLKRAGLE